MNLRALRALLRVEWRQLKRHPGRSWLVLMLIAVPVAAIVGGSGLARSIEPNPEQRASEGMGRADIRIEGFDSWPRWAEAKNILPAGAETLRGFTGLERVSVPGRQLRAKLFALAPEALAPEALAPEALAPAAKPGLAFGMLKLLAGRVPANAGEVALSPTLLEGLKRTMGDTVALEFGGFRVITGVVVAPEDLQLPVVLRVPAQAEYPGRHFLLAELPEPGASALAETLRSKDFAVLTRAEAAVDNAATTAFVYALGTVGLFEAALVISAAFAVSLRRRQVEIGLLGASGATETGITASLLLSAALLAVLGGVLGSILGVTTLAAVHPWLDGWTNRMSGPLTIPPQHVLGALLLGSAAAVLAAIVPARGAARLPIRQALAGRRPTIERSRRALVAGLLMISSGIALLLMAGSDHAVAKGLGVTLGPIFSIIGFGACSPWLLEWTARRAAGFPLSWRLAVRDAGRFRERNGAVVTAVLAGMAMSVTLAVLVASLDATIDAFPAQLREDHLLVTGPGAEETARRLSVQIPTVAAAPLAAAYLQGEPIRGQFDGKGLDRRSAWIAVGDEELLRALGAESAAAAFRDGHLLALDIPPAVAEIDLVTWIDGKPVASPETTRVATGRLLHEPVLVLASEAARQLEFAAGPPPRASLTPWLVRLENPVASEQLERARGLAAGTVGTTVDAGLLHQNRFRGVYLVVLLLCLATGIVVVVSATALSAAESAADERLLHTVGAAPRLVRQHHAARAGYLALLGCLLAVPAGLLAALAMFGAVNFPLTLTLPWRDLLFIAAGLPAIIYVGTWCFGKPQAMRQTIA